MQTSRKWRQKFQPIQVKEVCPIPNHTESSNRLYFIRGRVENTGFKDLLQRKEVLSNMAFDQLCSTLDKG
jgi:hypothetical protein